MKQSVPKPFGPSNIWFFASNQPSRNKGKGPTRICKEVKTNHTNTCAFQGTVVRDSRYPQGTKQKSGAKPTSKWVPQTAWMHRADALQGLPRRCPGCDISSGASPSWWTSCRASSALNTKSTLRESCLFFSSPILGFRDIPKIAVWETPPPPPFWGKPAFSGHLVLRHIFSIWRSGGGGPLPEWFLGTSLST